MCSSFPSKPLNERLPDLTWEAWLLVDENQNQNHNKHPPLNPDGTLRRRITPKSVFIAPTFIPESLPACADGYSSDPTGRCIKIIKLDEEAHYDFIIKNLEDKYGSFDYEEEEENVEDIVKTSQGPLQLNIPLQVDKDDTRNYDNEDDTDVAIVVSPTKPIFDMKQLNFNKRDSLADEEQQEILLKQLVRGGFHTTTATPIETTTSELKEETTNTEATEEKTVVVETDVVNKNFNSKVNVTTDKSIRNVTSTPENIPTATITESQETSTFGATLPNNDYDSVTETLFDISTSTDLLPVETSTEDTSTTTLLNTPAADHVTFVTDRVVRTEYKITTQRPEGHYIQNDAQINLTPAFPQLEPPTGSPKPDTITDQKIRFPDQEQSYQNTDNSFVRFPGSDSYNSQIPSSLNTREIQEFGMPGYSKQRPNEKPVVFRDNFSTSDNANLDYSEVDTLTNKATRWEFNRRNRDKNSSVFMLPPKWNPSTFQKPLVLRFSRKHAFMDNNDFKNPTYYRSIPPDDFAYLFKFKQKKSIR